MSDRDLSRRRLLNAVGAGTAIGLTGYGVQASTDGANGPRSMNVTETPPIETPTDEPDPCGHVEHVVNTGYSDANDATIDPGGVDDDWRVTYDDKNGSGSVPRPADVVETGEWPSPFGGSRWISIDQEKGRPLPEEGTRYAYTYCFCLREGFERPLLRLAVQADDRVVDIRLNGRSLPYSGSGSFREEPIEAIYDDPEYFEPGENCLTVVVEDVDREVTGLNVAGSVIADEANCDCRCDLTVTKRPAEEFEFGQPGTYVVEVCNEGDSPCSTPVTIRDRLPGTLEFVDARGEGWDVDYDQGTVVGRFEATETIPPRECLPAFAIRVDVPTAEEWPCEGDEVQNCVRVFDAGGR